MSVILDMIDRRINKENKNWMAMVCGETGSGKSYSAMKIAESIDEEFNVDRIVFTAENFMKLLNSGTLHRGNMVIWDEAGVGMAAREWYSLSNKVISYTLQTFRRENLGVLFTTPTFDFVDSQARKLFHAFLETMRINKEKRYVKVKYLIVQNNPREGKPYYKYPREIINGRRTKITGFNVGKPSVKLVHAYEKKKKEFTDKLKLETEAIIKGVKEKNENKKPTDINDLVEKVMADITYYTKVDRGRHFLDRPLIMMDFNISKFKTDKIVSIIDAKERKKKEETT